MVLIAEPVIQVSPQFFLNQFLLPLETGLAFSRFFLAVRPPVGVCGKGLFRIRMVIQGKDIAGGNFLPGLKYSVMGFDDVNILIPYLQVLHKISIKTREYYFYRLGFLMLKNLGKGHTKSLGDAKS